MRRVSYWPYIFILVFFFCIFNMPKKAAERVRSFAVCSFSPGWQGLHALKGKVLYLLTLPFSSAAPQDGNNVSKIQELEQENALLLSQLEEVRHWLLSEDRVQEQYERLEKLKSATPADAKWKEFFKRRGEELNYRLQLHAKSLSASVIFREPSAWSSALWINVGERQNRALGEKIVAKNSPVLSGTSIIGVVEYVGEARSRVRLITDEKLAPSVRAVRGREQNRFLLEHVDAVRFALERRDDLFASRDEAAAVLNLLSRLGTRLGAESEDMLLAKGEIFGCSAPLWRARSPILKGLGFNYDFADEEGPARDLRTGEPYGLQGKKEQIPLLRAGDILVTTGLDAVFPAGFRVGVVSKVQMLKEGASSYEIEAVATAGNLDEISHVIVLPSMNGSE
jgi:rod shape-determining protein MreC